MVKYDHSDIWPLFTGKMFCQFNHYKIFDLPGLRYQCEAQLCLLDAIGALHMSIFFFRQHQHIVLKCTHVGKRKDHHMTLATGRRRFTAGYK